MFEVMRCRLHCQRCASNYRICQSDVHFSVCRCTWSPRETFVPTVRIMENSVQKRTRLLSRELHCHLDMLGSACQERFWKRRSATCLADSGEISVPQRSMQYLESRRNGTACPHCHRCAGVSRVPFDASAMRVRLLRRQ